MTDELNPDVRRLVSLTRQARTPGDADKRRVAERLAVPLAAGAAVGAAATTAKASLLVKLAAGVAVVAAVTAAIVSQRPAAPPRAPAVPAAPSVSLGLPAPKPPESESEPEAKLEEAPPVVSAQPAPPKPSRPAPSRAPTSARELEEEAALLHQAQAAWRAGQSAKALELANQHAQRFPRSQLGSERDVLRVLSLCKLGQVQSAKQVGARLLKSAQGSPWYQSVASSCAAP